MKKKRIIIFAAILMAITLITVFVHLNTREEVAENTLQISVGDEVYSVNVEELEFESITGTYVTGKGEEREVEAPGILIKDILEENGITDYSEVTVIADDSYSARITEEEIKEETKAYLLKEEDSLRLIVFGDENSKRNVKNVVEIVVE